MNFLSRSLEFSHNCPHIKTETDRYLVSEEKYDLIDIIIFRSLNNIKKKFSFTLVKLSQWEFPNSQRYCHKCLQVTYLPGKVV